MTTLRIGIVGAGVAGTAAALLLSKQGHNVTLLERAPLLGPFGAGVLLQPLGQLVLHQMGLLEPVIAHAEPINELHVDLKRGRTLMRLPFSAAGISQPAYGIHRGDLFTTLYKAAQQAGVTIITNTCIEGIQQTSNTVTLSSNQQSFGPFDLVIAADGNRSTIRSLLTIKKHETHYSHGALWYIGTLHAIEKKLYQVVHGSSHLMGLLPMGQGRCSFFWGLNQDHYQRWQDKGLAAWKSAMVDHCHTCERLLAPINDWNELRFTTWKHVRLKQHYQGRVVLIGDAAHAMSPHLGQGVNLGLLDAWTLAHCLKHDSIDASMRQYQQQRRQHLQYYGAITYALTPFFQSDYPILGWLRNLGLPILSRLPFVRPQMALTMAGLKAGFLRGKMNI